MLLKRSVAVAQEHGDCVGISVANDEVELPVDVEVARAQTLGTEARREVDMLLKRAISIAEKNRNGIVDIVSHG